MDKNIEQVPNQTQTQTAPLIRNFNQIVLKARLRLK